MTILQQRIFETQIYYMTNIRFGLFLNSLLQFARVCSLPVMTIKILLLNLSQGNTKPSKDFLYNTENFFTTNTSLI